MMQVLLRGVTMRHIAGQRSEAAVGDVQRLAKAPAARNGPG